MKISEDKYNKIKKQLTNGMNVQFMKYANSTSDKVIQKVKRTESYEEYLKI